MGWLDTLLGRHETVAVPLYAAIVARGRAPHWYVEGQVPDTVDGRFDMIASVLSMVLLRLEAESQAAGSVTDGGAADLSARLTERFVEDMDGQLREMGVGDVVVGKHVGRMMSMLGGRIGAYRAGLDGGGDALGEALVRNLWRGMPPDAAALAHVGHELRTLRERLVETPLEALEQGVLP